MPFAVILFIFIDSLLIPFFFLIPFLAITKRKAFDLKAEAFGALVYCT